MPSPQIVVGVDGSPRASNALAWAGDAAQRSGRALLIVHASGWEPSPERHRGQERPDLLAEAASAVTSAHPELTLQVAAGEGEPAELLLELAEHAELLVIGRPRPNIRLLRIGSVGDQVLGHALCPTVVVGDDEPTAANQIVVGVSASPGGMKALDFAFAEAQRRGADLIAVRSWAGREWQLSAAAGLGFMSEQDCEHAESALVQRCLRRAGTAYPGVVARAVVTGVPVELALEEHAVRAAMLVLGSRRHDGACISRLGPITSWLAHHARCPVAVVGHLAADVATDLQWDAEPAGVAATG